MRRVAAAASVVASLAVAPAAALGAPGDLDTSFGSGGRFTLAVGPRHANINAAVAQPDGKLVVAGFAEQSGTAPYNRDFLVARVNPNGTLDVTFNPGGATPGVVTTPVGAGAADDTAFGVALGPTGAIYAVGTTDPPAQFADLAIVRYTSTGATDTGFSLDGIQVHDTGSVEGAFAAAVQPDNQLVIATPFVRPTAPAPRPRPALSCSPTASCSPAARRSRATEPAAPTSPPPATTPTAASTRASVTPASGPTASATPTTSPPRACWTAA